MPDSTYFRQPATQTMLLDIMFIWCKLNPDVGYRQGMHELLGIVLWVVERDAIQEGAGSGREKDELLKQLCAARYIEHDTFTLFGLIMQNAKAFYDPGAQGGKAMRSTEESPMLVRCRRIFDNILPRLDAGLSEHLHSIDVVPQIFLMRWTRLLFGREFSFDDTLPLWDLLFAEDPSLELVDYISVAMLLRIRWELMQADANEALALVLRYPSPAADAPAQTFVDDAVYLTQHANEEGGTHIVKSRTGRAPPLIARVARPSSPPHAIPGSPAMRITRPSSAMGSPSRSSNTGSQSLETVFSDAARTMYSRTQRLGISRALRDTVGDIRRNVQQGLQSGRSSPARQALFVPTDRIDRPEKVGYQALMDRISRLEARNKALGTMLESAVAELWACQKEKIEISKSKEAKQDEEAHEKAKETEEKLSVAIAKVQFVQVYLEDSTIPLPVEDAAGNDNEKDDLLFDADAVRDEHDETVPEATMPAPAPALLAPGEKTPQQQPPSRVPVEPSTTTPRKASVAATAASKPSSTLAIPQQEDHPAPLSASQAFIAHRTRPSIEHSSFSWMLGQDSATAKADFAASSARSTGPPSAQRRSKGFLFGDEEEDALSSSPSKAGGGPFLRRGSGDMKEKKKPKGKREKEGKVDEEEGDEGIDLGPLGGA